MTTHNEITKRSEKETLTIGKLLGEDEK